MPRILTVEDSEMVHRLLAAKTDMGEMSYDQMRDMVCMAICDRAGKDVFCYVADLYSDRVVYELGEHYYECSYTIADGKVTLGEPKEVQREVTYVPIAASAVFLSAAAGDASGSRWRVRIVAFGPDMNGIDWGKETLAAALSLFNGAKVFALKESQHVEKDKKFGKPITELVGAISNAGIEADGVYGDIVILPSGAWVSDDLKACEAHGIPYVYGLSVDIRATTKKVMVGGKQLLAPVAIKSVQVDVVHDPAAGGEFLQQLAAARQSQEEEQMFQKLLAALQGKRPDLHKRITDEMTAGTMTEAEALNLVAAATVKDAGGDDTNATLVASVVTSLTAAFSAQTENTAVTEMKLLACGMKLDAALTASGLPDASQKHIRAQFAGTVFEETALQAAIKGMKEMVDTLNASGQVTGVGGVRVGYESCDKLQAAFDGMFGVKVEGDLRVKPFTSLRAAYVEMTGDHDVTGVITPDNFRRLQAAYGDTSFSFVLGNTMYRRMAQDYREISDYGVSLLVGGNIRNAVDFRPLETIRVGYYGGLPVLDTDKDDYPDLGEVSDEEVEYALAERGGIITIKRRTLINDDMRLVDRIVSRLGRGARRGLARVVWTPFLTNAAYKGDTKAIFHADHGNLGSTAYGIVSALAAKTALAQQTEPGSGERLMLRPVTVAFPSELFGVVSNVNNYNPQAVAIADANSMYNFFKPERMFENPFMTDATDWLMFADPNECEIVELAFLNGQQEPQMFIANMPSQGQMFLNGSIQYKVQHDYAAEVVDYRGAYKAVVA